MQQSMGALRWVGALSLVVFGASGLCGQSTEATAFEVKTHPKWKWTLPAETWSKVGAMIPIPHQKGEGFQVSRDGSKLRIDHSASGGQGTEVAGVSGSVVLRGTNAEGGEFAYPVRLRKVGEDWEWASGGSMQGTFEGQAIHLFDQNNNGRFNDLGQDAMIVGKGEAASFLSKVVSVKGDLYTAEYAADGRSVQFAPFVGESGKLDLASQFKANGSLDAVVVNSADGQWSFEVSGAKKGLNVPAGEYVIASGRVSAGSEKAKVRTGGMKPIVVAAGQTASVAWGAEMHLDFDFTAGGGQVTVDPANMRYIGAAGEEYYDWEPNAVSPKILIANAKSGRPLGEGRFGGC